MAKNHQFITMTLKILRELINKSLTEDKKVWIVITVKVLIILNMSMSIKIINMKLTKISEVVKWIIFKIKINI